MRSAAILKGGQKVLNVHDPRDCSGQACPIHNPSDHHMVEWNQQWMAGSGLYRRCEHGYLHRDPDVFSDDPLEADRSCDGCCDPEKYLSLETIIDDLRIMIEETS